MYILCIYIYISLCIICIVPLTHNSKHNIYIHGTVTKKKKLPPLQNTSFLNRNMHTHTHTCIYRFLTLEKNSVSPLYNARKSSVDSTNAHIHEHFRIACKHCAVDKPQAGSTALQDGCVPTAILFRPSRNKCTKPSHTLLTQKQLNDQKYEKEKSI